MQQASKKPDIASLLAETRTALAHLRADELETLAARAEEMLFNCSNLTSQLSRDTNSAASCVVVQQSAGLLREHRLLGDLLHATGENLRILRLTRANAAGGARWAR